MAVMNFANVLAVAQALLSFSTPALGSNIPLNSRGSVNTTSLTPSPTITTGPSIPTGSFNLNSCTGDPDFGTYWNWHDCYRSENPAPLGSFEPWSPYNTTLYPYAIVPPNPSLASLCGSSWTSSASAFWSTDPITTHTNSERVITDAVFVDTFSWKPSEPCCLNCTLLGGSVDVMVWPTPAPTPAVSTIIDTAGNFTFISPSIYVAFESIGATDLCGSVGSPLLDKTLAFDPTALSTQRNYYAGTGAGNFDVDYCTHALPNGPWETFDYLNAAGGKCTELTTSWWSYYGSNDTTKYTALSDYSAATDVSCGQGCAGVPVNRFTCVYNPCSPWISVPTQVYDFNPKFSTCVDGIKAFFDPPYTLTKGGSLGAFTSVPVSSSKAAPAGTAVPEIASPTPPPAVVAPTPTPTAAGIGASSGSGASKDPAKVSNGPAATNPNAAADPAPTSGAHIVTSNGVINLVVGSQTLLPGSSLIVSGKTYSLAQSGNALVVDGTSQYLMGSETLVAGGAALTVSGTVVSLASGGQSVVVGGSTQAAGSVLGTSSGIGGAIMTIGGFAGPGSTAGENNGAEFTGSSGRNVRDVCGMGFIGMVCLGVLWLL